jgi:hypothetical protein
MKKLLSEMYSGKSILQLTQEEISLMLKSMMWQAFLIDTFEIKVTASIGDFGSSVKITIEGDINNLTEDDDEVLLNDSKNQYLEEDNDEIEE